MKRVRILSFNIHGGRGRDGRRNLQRINALLNFFDIDIGIFQEVETRPSRGGAASDIETLADTMRPYRFLGPNMKEGEGWYGNLVISRHPLFHSYYHDLQTHQSYEPRSAIDTLFKTPIGPLRVVGTHLSLFPLERRREAYRLLQLMNQVRHEEKYPLILTGDINEWLRPSKLLRTLDQLMMPVPCKATFPAWFPILKLDRVWQDAPDHLVTAHRLADRESRVLSDHLPLLIEIEKSGFVSKY